jgi:NADH-quinone oxidoreductase subunit G
LSKITIDDIEYIVNDYNQTIFQFCFSKDIYIPCFCYHEKLSIAGNCRICLLQVNESIVVSCAIPLAEEMVIYTKNLRVIHSREGILEFLLVNHPLDCPICDQGGECDLQDISLFFGSDKGRFYEFSKRSVSNLSFCDPLVKTIMTRCIHCTRCVRFLNEILGIFDLGLIGRGFSMEIGTFIENSIDDALSANIIDLCPVGALTSMPYAFTSRSWELSSLESIDLLDGLASKIRIDICNNKIMRILPSLDEHTNEEWISNKLDLFMILLIQIGVIILGFVFFQN